MKETYTHEQLIAMHTQYMMYYDNYIDTEWAWLITRATRGQLVETAAIASDNVAGLCYFMVVYKDNVYDIEAANERG